MSRYTHPHPGAPDRIVNVHRRTIRGDMERAGEALETLGSHVDELWPADRWAPMVLSDGLSIGSSGGHSGVRYSVTEHEKGRSVTFAFPPSFPLVGTHSFELRQAGAGTVELTHILDIERPGLLMEAIVIPGHDATLEDLLDQAEALLEGRPLRRKPSAFRSSASFIESVIDASALPSSPRRRLAGVSSAIALAGIGAVHVAWACGSSWPVASRGALAANIIGARKVPGQIACLTAAGALGAAAAAVDIRTADRHVSARTRSLAAAATAGAAGVLALRGIGGGALAALGRTPQPYRSNDLRLFSPLSLFLAAILAFANSRPIGGPPR